MKRAPLSPERNSAMQRKTIAGVPLLGRLRVSPATAIACVALFSALGGTSAAMVVALPAASVGNAQLKANAVTSSKVKNGSLLRRDFAASQIPVGARGPAGPA